MLGYLLRNRFNVGEVAFKGEILPGEQPAIVDRALFDAVQVKLSEQLNSHTTRRMKSEALLMGKIFDDRGNRMGPMPCTKTRHQISILFVIHASSGPTRAFRNHISCSSSRNRGNHHSFGEGAFEPFGGDG